jgi:hypothetical protein
MILRRLFLGKIFAFIIDLLQCPGMGILDTQKIGGDGLAKFRIFHFLHDTKTAGCKLRLNLNTQFLIAAF